ncbi:hypothetical protein OSB04_006137 [Centaurea solstitialis]|uniref:MULE transposase domain-containing protein n=1 Tax=Centaurea solstitialis TaxID=347529 RepID=A0AA38WH55_9ASTR|nr:hypothetical protein OSB04_006137 [Centaurea solstitialis]
MAKFLKLYSPHHRILLVGDVSSVIPNIVSISSGKKEFRNSNGIGKYECYSFIEHHNHSLLSSDDVCFSRKRRQLGFEDQMLIHQENISNTGATRVHKMRTSLKGGYEFYSSSSVDFQNFKRDMDKYVVKSGDAQMFIEMMNRRKKDAPNFFFDYKVSNSKLVCVFWADEASRFNYTEFGDMMSFDATFRTNRYCMIFVPFTVVDNHKKVVVIGVALVNKETVSNFKWFSSQFLKETNFRKELNKIMWDVLIDLDDFELKWNTLMEDYCLTGQKWLKSLYKIRENIPMCSLMKTTSRLESINSFFNVFSHYGNTFVFFMKSFDAALNKQRFTTRNLDYVTRSTFPKFLTPSKIERNASDVYTRHVFNDVQKEIYKPAWSCSIESVVVDKNDIETYTIDHPHQINKNK